VIEIEIGETGPGKAEAISAEQAMLLARSGVVNTGLSTVRAGWWQVSGTGKVGAARIGDVVVYIRPKVPIARLLFLAGYAEFGPAWRTEDVRVDSAADLVPAMADALWRQVARAIHQGLLPGYVEIEESSAVLRGRLRESEQLRRHHGLPLPLEIRHVAVSGFLLDMPVLFESFVSRALADALAGKYGGRIHSQDWNPFDLAGRVRLRPDLVWKLAGAPLAVVDAKYKAESPAGYPNADLYQLLAYCTVLGLRHGHLVYAKGEADAARHAVRRSGIEIHCHALDLAAEPAVLLTQVSKLADDIAECSGAALIR